MLVRNNVKWEKVCVKVNGYKCLGIQNVCESHWAFKWKVEKMCMLNTVLTNVAQVMCENWKCVRMRMGKNECDYG